jgi:hypothetical protein
MRHIAAKFAHRLLTNDQRQRRVNVCLQLQEKANEEPTFISMIIMGDKSWIYGYDPETKQQFLQWKSPHSLRAKRWGWSVVQQRACSLFFFMLMG